MGNVRAGMLWIAPLLALGLLLWADLVPGKPEVTRTAALAVWMALWWITGVVPLAATALLPIALLPALGVLDAATVAEQYFNDTIALYVGGFLVALAMERWNLHRRVALRLLLLFGVRPWRLLLGFMVPTFFLSMWISNTAAAMMMTPIVISVLPHLSPTPGGTVQPRRESELPKALLLGVAYAASIGGTATLVGTPPNLSFARIYRISFPDAPEISFAQWFMFGFPLALIVLLTAWLVLAILFARGRAQAVPNTLLRGHYEALGPMRREEHVVGAAFTLLALLWLTRADLVIGEAVFPGWARLFPQGAYIKDGTIAMAVAALLFTIPARNEPGARILDWPTANRLPWDIVLLFGGGFALAAAFTASGLSEWIGGQLSGLGVFPPIVLVLGIALGASLLTELTSNVATTEMLLPILASMSVAIGVHPLLIMVPATLACSYAFMLPVATPPNAVVFAAGRLEVRDMVRGGFLLNLFAVSLLTIAIFTLGPLFFGF